MVRKYLRLEWRVINDELRAVQVFDDGSIDDCGWCALPGSQTGFLNSKVFEVLYEGTRGPGKTDALLVDFAKEVGQGWRDDWRGILFRRTYKQLADVVDKSRKLFRSLLHTRDATFNESKHEWHFSTGEVLMFRYMERPADYDNYHGWSVPWIAWEELTTWPDDQCYKPLMSICRSKRPGIPKRVRATTNPYGIGHNWVKKRFQLHMPRVGPHNQGPLIEEPGLPARTSFHGMLRENKVLLKSDPAYIANIRAAARNENQLRAWVDGDWNIVSGGMFDDVWDEPTHVLPVFSVPPSWTIYRSFDWGSSKPFSVGWWAISDGSDLALPDRVMSTVRGDRFRIREWYGWSGQDNEGVRMSSEEISRGIVEREIKWGIRGRVRPGPADSSIFNPPNDPGPSIATRMQQRVRIGSRMYAGVQWTRADKRPGSRKLGWEAMRNAMKDAKPAEGQYIREKPGMFVCDCCSHFLRTVPGIPRCDKDPDDVNTDAEDHVADESRYFIRSGGKVVGSGRTVGHS